jgi:hypothetical protein
MMRSMANRRNVLVVLSPGWFSSCWMCIIVTETGGRSIGGRGDKVTRRQGDKVTGGHGAKGRVPFVHVCVILVFVAQAVGIEPIGPFVGTPL